MKKHLLIIKLLIVVVVTTLSINISNAQPGCPDVDAGADVTIPCSTNCTNLTATYFNTGNTNTYGVSQIPYTPFAYNVGTPLFVGDDDIWSDTIHLPFTFCFFGQAYTKVVVGANGLISFDASEANLGCAWDITAAGTIPSSNVYGNTIMGPYHDIDPSLGGTIKYQIIGSAPCRIFVVSYYQVPMYESDNFVSTCSGLDATHQIAIYETTNAIEVYIDHKRSCPDGGFFTTGWNDGLAIEGIQNAAQTVAYTVPGRNNTVWDADNDAWRFTPNGASIVSIDWLSGGTVIGSGTTLQVCPTGTTTYTARATYNPCSGGTPVVVTDDVTVNLAGLQITGKTFTNPTCAGNNGTAAVTLNTANAVMPVTYGWSNGASTLSISGLAAGTYIFTATDAANCTRRDTVILVNPPAVNVTVPNAAQFNCSGTGMGTLLAVPSGGTPGYSYVWNSNPAQNDSVLDNVLAGTYSVTITDAGGCTATNSGTLTVQVGTNNVALGSPTITDVDCNGNNNGSIAVTATGGTGTFTYTWSGGYNGSTINSLPGGQYTVTVDDGASCTATGTYTVNEPTPLVIGTPVIQNIGCVPGSTGSINANASGGTTAYTFNWAQQSNSQTYTGGSITGLSADTYNLTVTDANLCSATASYQVTQVPSLAFTQSSTNVSCNGGTDGSATINVTQGTAPYMYNWNGNGNTVTGTLSGLSAGINNVTVSDVNCTATATFTITEPPALAITQTALNNISCNGANDGSVMINVTGGTVAGNYVYVWSSGNTTATASNLQAGTATVTVTDDNLCNATASYQITEPSALSTLLNTNNAVCYQSPTGNITVTASGGTQPYTYLWTNGSTSRTANALYAGTYVCTVTDASNCSVSATDLVTEPLEMVLTPSATAVKCIGQANGTITINVNPGGGTPPYNYSVTQGGSSFVTTTNGIAEGLAVGDYTALVSDNNGCTQTIPVSVPDATIDTFSTSTDSTKCYGDEYNDGIAHIIALSITNGPYLYSIDGGPQQYGGDFYTLSAGIHTINAVSNNGCITDVNVDVKEPLPITVEINPDSLILPLGEGQSVSVTYANASGVTYQWYPTTGLSCIDCPTPTVTIYNREDYNVTVSSVNGTATCYGTALLHVDVKEAEPVFIPNSFSPNGDGNNDLFTIYGTDISAIDLKIFNRWGELIYATTNQFGGWDGTYKGQLQMPQVYTYVARVTYLNHKKMEKKGTVTLLN